MKNFLMLAKVFVESQSLFFNDIVYYMKDNMYEWKAPNWFRFEKKNWLDPIIKFAMLFHGTEAESHSNFLTGVHSKTGEASISKL